jgi:trk system potassium uptake protein TrkH
MHALTILKVVGALLVVIGGAQVLPAVTSWGYGDRDAHLFLQSALLAVVLGSVLVAISWRSREISLRDGFVVVTVAWVTACLAGAIPLYTTGATPTFVDAMFESMSGYTTTGSSIIPDISQVSHGVLLWRSLTQWFGGMGIILLGLAILPALGVAGMQLYEREVSGPYHDKLTPRLRDTAMALWTVYVLFTAAETVILTLLGMDWFEAVNHSMATLATGGFGTRTDSIGSYGPAIEWAITVFMLLGGMNFALHFKLLTHPARGWAMVRDIEWRWYVGAVVLFSLIVAAFLFQAHDYHPGRALTKAAFQVTSIMTTTGFASDDFVRWGGFAQLVLLYCMLAGGCAGSTSGGLKWVRILLMFKNARLTMLRLLHPNVVRQPKINDVPVTEEIQSNIGAFVFLYFVTLAAVTLLLTLDGLPMITAFSAAATSLGNVGPGLDRLGPADSFAWLSPQAKLILTGAMLMGRLELMTVLMVILPRTWRG